MSEPAPPDLIGGPWHYQEESDAYTHIVRGPSNAFIVQLSQTRNGRSEARARLMAAAPDLLATLLDILEMNDDFRANMPAGWEGDLLQDACEDARAVIARHKLQQQGAPR
jgi:hypothetical protein